VAIYAIGDVQGCYTQLQKLLSKLNFNAEEDTLWFSGDLVNRGHQSLDVLRFVKNLGAGAVTVLGNHDLHLMAVAEGVTKYRRHDTFKDILDAADRDDLLTWLRHQPLLHYDAALNMTMVHAGIVPQWSRHIATQCASEVEAVLRSSNYRKFFKHMYGDEPNLWSDSLTGWERLRFITNTFTRLRYCDKKGRQTLQVKGPLGSQPKGYLPWFNVPNRQSRGDTLLFGHWASLGTGFFDNVIALDSACAWGGSLSALRIDVQDNRQFINVPCKAVAEIT